jgi:hypothetical protein
MSDHYPLSSNGIFAKRLLDALGIFRDRRIAKIEITVTAPNKACVKVTELVSDDVGMAFKPIVHTYEKDVPLEFCKALNEAIGMTSDVGAQQVSVVVEANQPLMVSMTRVADDRLEDVNWQELALLTKPPDDDFDAALRAAFRGIQRGMNNE